MPDTPNDGERAAKPPDRSHSQPRSKTLYTADDLEGFVAERDLGFPGQYPFAGASDPMMYRSRPWTMRQYAGMGDADQSNRRYKFLLANRTAGLSVAFDLPTQIGYDSDSRWSLGEVGKAGVAIDSIEDMERLFSGIRLDAVSTSMTINATAAILLALYAAAARRSGAEIHRLSGTVQNDILKEHIARGTYIYPIRHGLRLATDIIAWTHRTLPAWNSISISGYHMREAGSTAVQEVAFTLANGRAYLQAARDAGLDIDLFAPRLSFFFNAHNDIFTEAARVRAARRLWAHITREHFEAKDPRSWMLRFHTQTGGSTLTAQQPENNIIRTTVQALSAVLGGTQSLHTNGYDEALSLPTEEAARIALRTQQILACESGVAQTVDPLAGSYYVESLTNTIEQEAAAYLKRIDELGGMLAAIERGWVQQEIQNAAYEQQLAIDRGDVVVVGVNRFIREDPPDTPVERRDEALEARQIERVRAVRLRRDPIRWRTSLDRVREHAGTGENLMPAILEAVESYATVGEIAGVLRAVFGEYRETVVI